MVVIRIGTIYDMTNPEAPSALVGYHVDTTEKINGADAFQITPANPYHSFADAITFRYKFNDKAQADTFIGQE